MTPTDPTLIELDPRGRVSLKKLAGSHDRYLASRYDDGTIVLEPAAVVTEAQARYLASPHVADALEAAMARPDRVKPYKPGRRA